MRSPKSTSSPPHPSLRIICTGLIASSPHRSSPEATPARHRSSADAPSHPPTPSPAATSGRDTACNTVGTFRGSSTARSVRQIISNRTTSMYGPTAASHFSKFFMWIAHKASQPDHLLRIQPHVHQVVIHAIQPLRQFEHVPPNSPTIARSVRSRSRLAPWANCPPDRPAR